MDVEKMTNNERSFDKLTDEEKDIVKENFYLGLIDSPTDKNTRKDMGLEDEV